MILINDDVCELCFGCAAICPVDAIEVDVHQAKINQDLCTNCKLCIKACPLGAISE
ncbi:MAG: 4Fe-4S binding protein [Candidatus Ranarchaeia archaeon]